MHTDWSVAAVEAAGTPKPRSAWVVLHKGATLSLGLLPSKLTAVELMAHSLHVGDIVLIDGDVPHAGLTYLQRNIGLHVYLDSPAIARQTDPSKQGSFHHMEGFGGGRVAPSEKHCSSCGAGVQKRAAPLQLEAEGAPRRSHRGSR